MMVYRNELYQLYIQEDEDFHNNDQYDDIEDEDGLQFPFHYGLWLIYLYLLEDDDIGIIIL